MDLQKSRPSTINWVPCFAPKCNIQSLVPLCGQYLYTGDHGNFGKGLHTHSKNAFSFKLLTLALKKMSLKNFYTIILYSSLILPWKQNLIMKITILVEAFLHNITMHLHVVFVTDVWWFLKICHLLTILPLSLGPQESWNLQFMCPSCLKDAS
jgi:hypothetical protein